MIKSIEKFRREIQFQALPYCDALNEGKVRVDELGAMEKKRAAELAWRRAGLTAPPGPNRFDGSIAIGGERVAGVIDPYLTLQLRWRDPFSMTPESFSFGT